MIKGLLNPPAKHSLCGLILILIKITSWLPTQGHPASTQVQFIQVYPDLIFCS